MTSNHGIFVIQVFNLQEDFHVDVCLPDGKFLKFPYEGGEFNFKDKTYVLKGPTKTQPDYSIFHLELVPVKHKPDVEDTEYDRVI